MALRPLLAAAEKLAAARRAIDALVVEKQQHQDRIATINAELATQRANADAAIVTIKAEAADVVAP